MRCAGGVVVKLVRVRRTEGLAVNQLEVSILANAIIEGPARAEDPTHPWIVIHSNARIERESISQWYLRLKVRRRNERRLIDVEVNRGRRDIKVHKLLAKIVPIFEAAHDFVALRYGRGCLQFGAPALPSAKVLVQDAAICNRLDKLSIVHV